MVTVVPCSVPHNGQVFALSGLTDVNYLGQSAALQEGFWATGQHSRRCLLVDGAEDSPATFGRIRDV